MIRRAALAIALLCAAAPAAAAEDCGLKRAAWLDAELLPSGEFAIPAVVEGRPLALALDTGAFPSFLGSAFVEAAGMQRKTYPGGYGRDITGDVVRDYVVTNHVEVGPLKSTKRNLFGITPSSRRSGWEADGTLGFGYFENFDVEFDFAQKKVGFYLQDHCPGQVVHWAQNYVVIPIRDREGHLTFSVTLDGKHLDAIIDTGAPLSILDKDAARRSFGLVPGSPGMDAMVSIEGLSGHVSRAYRYQFKSLDMSGLSFRNVPVLIADTFGSDFILGMHELRFMHLYIAYKERKLYVTATPGEALARDVFAIGDMIDRGVAQARNGNYAQAFATFDQAIALDPARPDGYMMRAWLKSMRGDFAGAVADLSQAIGLDSSIVEAFFYRGIAHEIMGAYDLAVADFTTAIRLAPESSDFLGSRGVVHFALGRYSEASADFGQASKAAPENPYWPLWLHLTRMKEGVADAKELTANVVKVDRNAWPYAVVALYQGKMTSDEVRTAARKAEAEEQKMQACEAAFYSGEYELARNNSVEALRLFQEAVTTCPNNFVEYHGAQAELKRLVPQQAP